MAGAVLAGFGRGWMAKPWVHDAAIGLGLATLVGCFMFFDSAAAYPSWRAALPVGSAMLIIGAGNNSRLGPAVLAARELVERPIRHRKSSSLQLRALAGGIAAIALAGIIVVRADGFAFRFPAELRAAADVRPDVTTRTGECLVDLTGRAEISDVCIESARPLIAVWGDSTAGSLMPGLRALQSQQHFGIAQLTAQSCMPVLADAPSATCLEHNRLVAQRIRDLRPDVVLLHGFGPLNAGWERTLQFLASENLRTVVLGPVPAWKRRMPDQLMNYYITHRSLLPDRSSSLVSNLWDDRFAEQVSAAHGAAYISAWQVFCEADGCLTRTPDGALTTFDPPLERGLHFVAAPHFRPSPAGRAPDRCPLATFRPSGRCSAIDLGVTSRNLSQVLGTKPSSNMGVADAEANGRGSSAQGSAMASLRDATLPARLAQ